VVAAAPSAPPGRPPTVRRVRKRSVLIAGHPSSVSLEEPFWRALKEIARRRGTSLNKLIAEIDRGRHGGLSSAIRVFVLDSVRNPG